MRIRDYKYCVLDFDGTICDLNVDWAGLKVEINNRFGHILGGNPPGLMQIVNIISGHFRDELAELSKLIQQYEMPTGKPFVSNFNEELMLHVSPFYVISNNMHHTVFSALQLHGCIGNCKLILGLDDCWAPKPLLKSFKMLMQHTGCVNVKDYLYIGNTSSDLEFSLNCGIDYIDIKKMKYDK